MDLVSALSTLRASGSLLVRAGERRYRLVIREGVIRMVIDETGDPTPLDREEAVAALKEVVRYARAGSAEVQVSPIEVPVRPPHKGILVRGDELLLLA